MVESGGYCHPPGIKLSRRQLVLDTVDKDGGAHVDKTIPARLVYLIDGGWVAIIHDDRETLTEQKLHNQHFHYLRQLGYELLHSPELLALVGSDFSLPNDKTIKQQQAEVLRTSLERIASLQETGEKMAQSGDLLVARQIFDTLIKELETTHDEVSLELLARIFLSKAKTFSSIEDTEKAIAVYAQLLNAFNERTITRGNLKEIFIKTQFAKAVAHTLLNQEKLAIEYFQYVYRNTKVIMENQQPKLKFHEILELVMYILASLSNIIVFYLNTGRYEKVVESSNELLETFCKVMNVNGDYQTLQQILFQLDDVDASIIRGHLSKCLRNKLLALVALGRAELAREVYKDFEHRFTTVSESILQQCLNELRNVLKELRNVLGNKMMRSTLPNLHITNIVINENTRINVNLHTVLTRRDSSCSGVTT